MKYRRWWFVAGVRSWEYVFKDCISVAPFLFLACQVRAVLLCLIASVMTENSEIEMVPPFTLFFYYLLKQHKSIVQLLYSISEALGI